jgi:ADP-ribose diphosphatase
MYEISRQRTVFQTPWFVLEETLFAGDDAPYYAIKQTDYVCILCMSSKGRIVLVRQFRPAVNQMVLELPAGHVEVGEAPAEAARRELREETGYEAGDLDSLGDMIADSGRLANRQWCFFARNAVAISAANEPGIEVVEMEPNEFADAIVRGEFHHALHLAAITRAIVRGFLKMPVRD